MSHEASDCKDDWNNGTNPTCHSIGDTGADLFLAHRGGLDYIKEIWNVPSKFLHEVYNKVNMSISSIEIADCMATMFVGAQLEKLAGGVAFENYGKHAAFLSEELDLWFVGGIDDMASNVMFKWNTIINLLENRTTI